MNMIVCNSSSYSCQFCSPYGVGFSSTIRLNQARVARAGVVDICPSGFIGNNCFAFKAEVLGYGSYHLCRFRFSISDFQVWVPIWNDG